MFVNEPDGVFLPANENARLAPGVGFESSVRGAGYASDRLPAACLPRSVTTS
jgi:hypothetical protein